MTSPRRSLGALLALATIAAYWPAFAAGFVWDDDSYVTHNPVLADPHGWLRLWIPGETPQYYPAVFTTFWLEYRLWGTDPLGYHVVNVLLHAGNALLVLRLARRLELPWAFAVAALFALHPVHVESVAWVTERKNVLSGLGYLLAALAYLRFDERRSAGAPRAFRSYAAALAWFTLALLAKTVTCSLPAALILVFLWLRRPLTWPRLWPLLPMFALGLLLALQTAALERTHVGAAGADFAFSVGDRVQIASNALLFYPGKLLWPWPTIFFYPRWQLDDLDLWSYWPAAAVVLAFAATLWLARHGRRGPFVALAFTAGTLFPALGFFNVYPHRYSFVADHFQYLASLGVFALVAGTAAVLARRRGATGNTFVRLAGIAVLATLGVLTFRRCHAYADAETLWRDTIAQNPGAWIAHNNLAQIEADRGEDASALARLEHALTLTGSNKARVQIRRSIAVELGKLGRFDDAALAYEALQREVGGTEGRLALALVRAGRDREAEQWFRIAIADPEQSQSQVDYARYLLLRQRPAEAIAVLEPFAQAFPTAFGPRDLLASAYADAGRLDDAVAAAAAALALAEAAGQESGTRAAVDGERRRQVLEALRQKLAALRAAAARNRGR